MRELTENTLHILIHELKNPITIIMGYSQLLQNTDDLKTVKDFSKIISSEVDYASNLINNISTLNKLQENIPICLCKESVCIKDITSSLINIYKEKNPKVQWKSSIKNKDILYTDKTLLKIMLFNIIENASKYTQKGVVSLSLEYTENNTVFYIKDTGMGIEKDKLNNLTELYFRANNEIPGTGIGLFLVNQICKMLDAKLNIDSELNKGTKISITFPNQI